MWLAGCNPLSTQSHLAGGSSSTIHGVVRYAISNDLNTLNPVIGGLAYENAIEEAIFSGLVKLDGRERLVPDLATDVPSPSNGGVSADGRTITYHLRHGVLWQDGQPLTSADVAFTFARITDPNVNAPNSAPYTHVARVSTPDPYTVVVHLKEPWAPAIAQLFCNGENGSIIPKHALEHTTDFNRDAFGVHPIGSGPLQLVRWERGSHIILGPNAHYFGGAPKIKKVDVFIVPDANTRLTMLSARELDVVQIGNPNQVTRLRQLPGYRVDLVQYPAIWFLTFEVTRAPFDDVAIRKALAMALDRRRLVRTTFVGTAVVADSFIPPFNWAYEHDNGAPAFDLPEAQRILEAAGWRVGPDGVRFRGDRKLEFTLSIATGSAIAYSLAQQMQQAWREIGANVHIQSFPLNVLRSPTGLWTTGRFDVDLGRLILDPDPDRSANLGSQFMGARGFNNGRYASARSDMLTAKAVAAYDHAARKAVYIQLQRLWNSDLPVVPLAWDEAIYVVNSDMHGFQAEPVNSDFWNVNEWKI
jgi:peptide/nickel transport system substrate-binding protein